MRRLLVLVGVLVVLGAVGRDGVGTVDGVPAGAQESATLERRVAALEATVAVLQANALPRSPNLAPDGSSQDLRTLFTDPSLSIVSLCQQWDPLAQLNPFMRNAIAPGLVGLRCELAPSGGGGAPAASTGPDAGHEGNIVDADRRRRTREATGP